MKRFMLGMMFIVLGFVLVFGETYEHKEGGLSIWFPDAWKIKAEENILEADAPDEDAYVQLLMLEDVETMETAINKEHKSHLAAKNAKGREDLHVCPPHIRFERSRAKNKCTTT